MSPRPKNLPQLSSTLDTHSEGIVTVEHVELSRVVFVHSPHPLPWGEPRTWGPHPRCRWDPHPLSTRERSEHGVLYTAGDLLTCVAEVFADTRIIDTYSDMPLLQVWETVCLLRLLNLTSTWVLRNGVSVSFDSVPCSTCRAWARAIRTQLPGVGGLHIRSTMTGDEMTILFSLTRNNLLALPRDTAPLANVTLYALLKALASDTGCEIV